MKKTILILFASLSFSTFSSTKPACGPCQEADRLMKDWAAAKEPDKAEAQSEKSTQILKDLEEMNKRGIDSDVVHAIVSVLGTIYAHDDDPLDDELMRLKPALAKKPFREIFDQEVAKLPTDEKEKLMVGLDYVEHPTLDDLERD